MVDKTAVAPRSAAQKIERLRGSLRSVIRGKDAIIEQMIIALVAGGSVLIEDVPGVGKTTLAKTLARSVDLRFQRVQCTPDLLPADIFGFSVLNPQDGSFEFRRGPIFTNVLLVDEINRASPRTQSALLEAMAEHQVTVEGRKDELPSPFFVLATQNPVGFHGTFPLPESQLDRFLFQISMDYPDASSEVDILYEQSGGATVNQVDAVVSRDEILAIQDQSRSVAVERCVAEYLVEIVRHTREDPRIQLGGSPRGSLALFRAAQASATVQDRDYVTPDDIQEMAPFVLGHRVVTRHSGDRSNASQAHDIIRDLMSRVEIPT